MSQGRERSVAHAEAGRTPDAYCTPEGTWLAATDDELLSVMQKANDKRWRFKLMLQRPPRVALPKGGPIVKGSIVADSEYKQPRD